MHFRLQLWMVFFAFVAAAAVRGQAPAAAAPANSMPPGQIKAVKVHGTVEMILNGSTTALHDNDPVPQAATVVTQNGSGVILVFSNGATTQLGPETTLVIDEFLQDPFAQQVSVASLTAEPTTSRTKLHLTKGELVGNVKHLNVDGGSSFTVETPVGAAGIRGTTFRIVFRPSGTGQAFAIFSLSTLEGNVAFNNPGGQGQPSGTHGTEPSQGQTPGQNRGGAVAVTTGQEVVVTVSVDVNPTTGQVTVTAPVQVATTTPINPVVRAEIISQATTMATTVEQSQTTFNSTAGATSGGSSSGSSSSSSSSTDSGKSDSTSSTSGSTSSSTQSTGGTASTTPSTSGGTPSTTGSGTGSGNQLNTVLNQGNQNNATSGFTSPTDNVTPGAGKH